MLFEKCSPNVHSNNSTSQSQDSYLEGLWGERRSRWKTNVYVDYTLWRTPVTGKTSFFFEWIPCVLLTVTESKQLPPGTHYVLEVSVSLVQVVTAQLLIKCCIGSWSTGDSVMAGKGWDEPPGSCIASIWSQNFPDCRRWSSPSSGCLHTNTP